MNSPRKIAILGGGIASLTTAFYLTELAKELGYPAYDITVYQMGWRLGGKGASGRNQKQGNRIEEHGLHMWGGYYDNAFTLIRKCYKELQAPEFQSVDDAFVAQEDFWMIEKQPDNGVWLPWHFAIPQRGALPGFLDSDMPEPPQTIWQQIRRVFTLAVNAVEDLLLIDRHPADTTRGTNPPEANDVDHEDHQHISSANNILRGLASQGDQDVSHRSFLGYSRKSAIVFIISRLRGKMEAVLDTVDGAAEEAFARALIEIIDALRFVARKFFQMVKDWTPAQHLWRVFDYFITIFRGILSSRLFKNAFDSINHLTFDEWLTSNFIEPQTLLSPIVQSSYDTMFAYREGKVALEHRDMEAGTYLRAVVRAMSYKGAFMYRMRAGMGDIIFAPLYRLLRQRGVKFAYFHKVENLRLSADGKFVETIRIQQQAVMRNEDPLGYEPLIPVGRFPCWPNAPLYSQIKLANAVDEEAPQLESGEWGETRTITLHSHTDFDEIILGIPIGVLPSIASELLEKNNSWRAMLDNVKRVRTQSFQIWFSSPVQNLSVESKERQHVLQSCVPNTPINTWSSMIQTLVNESWESDRVKDVIYFTGLLADDVVPEQAIAKLRAEALNIFSSLYEHGIFLQLPDDHDLAANVSANNDILWDSQYFKVNIEPTDLYTMTVHDSSQHRLFPDESGFDNLTLAGDWTRNYCNLGMVEGAVMSGILAARKFCKNPTLIPIYGIGDWS